MTASAIHHRPLQNGGIWATTVAWGMNAQPIVIPTGVFDSSTHALLAESSATFHDRDTWFGRAELVEKPAEDLHAHEFGADIFTVAKLQAGYVRRFKPWRGMTPGVGGSISFNVVPPELSSRYGGRVAPGFSIVVTVRPPRQGM